MERRRGHWNRAKTAEMVYTKINIWQQLQQPLRRLKTSLTPSLNRGSTSYPWSTSSHFKCLLPDTIHHLPASCIFADIVTENWCHAMMWEILHLINCCVTPFNKNVLSLMFLEATAEFPAVWSLAWGSLRARGAQCGIEAAISVHCVVGEQQRRVGYLWIYSGAVGIHERIGV